MKEIDWDKIVDQAEADWRKEKWKEFGDQSAKDYGPGSYDEPISEKSNEILDEIAVETDRIDPDGAGTIDHEEVFRATGKYYIIRRKNEDE